MNKRLVMPVLFLLFVVLPAPGWADVSVPAMFSDHAVLQRGVDVPVWGSASAGEKVTVSFDGQVHTDVADGNGFWMVTLEPMAANGTGRSMTIEGTNTNTLVIDDILVGEVWLGSGQSNMQRPLSDDCYGPTAIGEAAGYPKMRFFNVTASGGNVANTAWEVSDAHSAASMSAVHYYFGRQLMTLQPGVPVGLITSAVGATAIERWATCAGSGSLYTGQVAPLQPYAIKGATWYQGEWDSRSANDAQKYYWQLPCLVSEWRSDWGQGAFPFYVVQMPKMGLNSIHIVRDAELQAMLSDQKVEMIVTIDQEGRDVHPACKDPFGTRLANLALKLEYGVDVPARSPVHNAAASFVEGDSIHVVFDHVANGLDSGDGLALAEWEIADANGKWFAADAVISGSDTVIVSSPMTTSPVSARYAYSSDPAANNLVNSDRLPASPIREITPNPGTDYCGNDECGQEEDSCNCSVDCWDPPDSELSCDDGIDNDCDGYIDCDGDDDCANDPLCANSCGNGICDPSEDCRSCPGDCEGVTTGKPSNRYCCGNGEVEGPEGDGLCDDNP
jgi:sialate O-acetylesterase